MYREKDDKTVNILGTDYKMRFVADGTDRLGDFAADGYVDTTIKEIVIGHFKPDNRSMQDLDTYQKKVMRHEIIHAFFYESGLWNNSADVSGWAINEEMVDWLAIQHSKLHTAFEKAGGIIKGAVTWQR